MNADIRIEFERECSKCYGTSSWMLDKKCDRCNSKGKVPTELGEELLEFLRNQGIGPVTSTKET